MNNKCNDSILHYQKFKNDQIDRLKEKYKKEEYYSFSPVINENTDSILKTKISNFNETNTDLKYTRHFDLHERHRQRLLKIKKLEDTIYNHNFTPEINRNISLISTFNERQDVYIKKVKDKSIE